MTERVMSETSGFLFIIKILVNIAFGKLPMGIHYISVKRFLVEGHFKRDVGPARDGHTRSY